MSELNTNQESEFLFYKSHEGSVKVQIILGDETVWANQKTISELFATSRENITLHLKIQYVRKSLQLSLLGVGFKNVIQMNKIGVCDHKQKNI